MKRQDNNRAQATIEFTFAMVTIALLIFGLIKVFQWVGMDYAQKSYDRQNSTIFINQTSDIEDNDRQARLVAYTHKF
ncbi:MAG: hypothetical protein HQL15_10300 [Candidatus Omnitrophica bacterium]|nr:hypothetical protein [Candidatus Omnitrophota bacterium]